ncbi:MipA/OmpV family protein [Burkholderia gladioli]|uniref:MipA/OmpV family protein n=1 Tax=Burkholderia gladioli TaxID=28095 RepID=UPI0016418877|nr:MipA/OmpV family protein [Burkholderia gladioli]
MPAFRSIPSSVPRRRASGRARHASRVALGLLALAGLAAGSAAHAQLAPGASLDLDVVATPRYAGASAYRVLPLPSVVLPSGAIPRLTFFTEGLDGGAAWALGPHLSVGPLIGFSIGRKQDDATILNGTGDLKNSFQYGAFVHWQADRLGLNVKFLQSARSGYGNQVTLGASYALLALPRDRVTISTDAVWSNGSAAQTDFGIDGAQAAGSLAHLPVYSASSGFSNVDLRLAYEHRFDAHWSLRASAGVGTLLGDAADSPIVERRTSVFGTLGVGYRF